MNARTINILCIALLAAMVTQLLHEATHGVVALLVGKDWVLFNLFAVKTAWYSAGSAFGDVVVEASAAVLNIAVGAGALALFYAGWARAAPYLRLWLFFLAAYSLLTGFGYLFADALFYDPNAPVGDWAKVITAFGGGWSVRGSVLLIGTLGTLAAFLWIARASLQFVPKTTEQTSRAQTLLPLLIYPYIVVNCFFRCLPIGTRWARKDW